MTSTYPIDTVVSGASFLAVTVLQGHHYNNHKLWNIALTKRDIFHKTISDLNIQNFGTIFLTKNTFTFINPIMYQNNGQRKCMSICYDFKEKMNQNKIVGINPLLNNILIVIKLYTGEYIVIILYSRGYFRGTWTLKYNCNKIYRIKSVILVLKNIFHLLELCYI